MLVVCAPFAYLEIIKVTFSESFKRYVFLKTSFNILSHSSGYLKDHVFGLWKKIKRHIDHHSCEIKRDLNGVCRFRPMTSSPPPSSPPHRLI